MHPWTAAQFAAFLSWSARNSQHHAAWTVLAMTGMRRGELLALRWRDVDLDAATITVRPSAGVVRNVGEGAEIREGATKTGKARVTDLDPGAVAVLRAWKAGRGSLALALARDGALVFSDLEDRHPHPERFSRTFRQHLARCRTSRDDHGRQAADLHEQGVRGGT